MKTRLDKWGNSLGLRLPKAVADGAGLHDGDTVDVGVEGGIVVIRPARPRYALEELLVGMSPHHDASEFESVQDIGAERFAE